jgi:hypothetical protein
MSAGRKQLSEVLPVQVAMDDATVSVLTEYGPRKIPFAEIQLGQPVAKGYFSVVWIDAISCTAREEAEAGVSATKDRLKLRLNVQSLIE